MTGLKYSGNLKKKKNYHVSQPCSKTVQYYFSVTEYKKLSYR